MFFIKAFSLIIFCIFLQVLNEVHSIEPLPDKLVESVQSVALYYYSPLYRNDTLIHNNTIPDSFSPDKPTKILIHGYITNRFHAANDLLKKSYMRAGNVNIIVVDWSQAAFQPYDVTKKLIPFVASQISQILEDFIARNKVDRRTIHIIGHSLGAHLGSLVGRYSGGTLGRVTGLDPAAPLYNKWSTDAMNIKDAQLVDIIHTCNDVLGDINARGHIDFYPNAGYASQPGCNGHDFFSFYACSHGRSVHLYAESIVNPTAFMAVKCSFNEISSKRVCYSTQGDAIPMGEYVPDGARGVYFSKTNGYPPYGKGNYSGLYV